MIRRISLQYGLVILLSLLAFAAASTLIVRDHLRNMTEENLTHYLGIVREEYEETEDAAILVSHFHELDQFLRISVISPTGIVLADSLSETTENHLNRPEIQHPGTAYLRHSETLNREMMYLAVQLDSGVFLRVAIPAENILPYLNAFIGISFLIGILIAVLSVFGSRFIAKQILLPLQDTAQTLKEVQEGCYVERLPLEKDEDMNRIINEINAISKLISRTIQSLNVEKRKRDFILDHMGQGLCVLDFRGRVVMINRYSAMLFDYDQEQEEKDFLYLFRDLRIQVLVKSVLEGGIGGNVMFSVADRFYSLAAASVQNDWNDTKSVVIIITDITDIKNVEILKRDFFLNASHELKSPLTSIIGSADLIANGFVTDPGEIVDLTKRIVQEASRMNRLVMDMLDLSKYETESFVRGNSPVEMAGVIEEVCKALEPSASARGISIRTDVEPIRFVADMEQMTQLVRNLVDNSIQYGIDGGFVDIRLHSADGGFRLEVEDNGIGIPKGDQTRVFERFYRVDKARSKTTGGTGLGLSIVKHICLIHQATLRLESELGKGTVISIFFPQK